MRKGSPKRKKKIYRTKMKEKARKKCKIQMSVR